MPSLCPGIRIQIITGSLRSALRFEFRLGFVEKENRVSLVDDANMIKPVFVAEAASVQVSGVMDLVAILGFGTLFYF